MLVFWMLLGGAAGIKLMQGVWHFFEVGVGEVAIAVPVGGAVVAGLTSDPAVRAAEPGIRVLGELRAGRRRIRAILDVADAQSRIWRPTVTRGEFRRGTDGLLLSEEAARDLGVAVGQTVVLRHPRRTSPTTLTLVDTPLRVAGTHPSPFRMLAFLDRSRAGILAMTGRVTAAFTS